MSTYGSPQRRYAEKKRKDPEYCARVLLKQRERYRRLVADPVTRKQLYERKKRSHEKCKEEKRLRMLERLQVVKNETMLDRDDGMVLDRKEESAVPVVGPPEEMIHDTGSVSAVTMDCSAEVKETTPDDNTSTITNEMNKPKENELTDNDFVENGVVYLKIGSDPWITRMVKDDFMEIYGNASPKFVKYRKTRVTEEETNEYWPVTSAEWMDRYVKDPDFPKNIRRFSLTPMYKKRLTDKVFEIAPDWVVQQKRYRMLFLALAEVKGTWDYKIEERRRRYKEHYRAIREWIEVQADNNPDESYDNAKRDYWYTPD